FNIAPFVFLPPDLTLCNGVGTVTWNASRFANGGYSWSPSNSNNPSPNNVFLSGPASHNITTTFNMPGIYTVTVYQLGGCTTTATINVTNDMLGASIVSVSPACGNTPTGSATATYTSGTPPYSYHWKPSGGNGATANHLRPGTYTVIVTDGNGCKDSAVAVIGNNCRNNHGKENGSSNSDTLAMKQVNVYPNPANSVLNIETELGTGEVENICLYNTFGQQVRCTELTDNITTISISNLAAGMYFYRVTDTSGNLIHSDKVVIIH
ncbi:MAG TPA: T9SS type A sorting domain-containing protein, partial [Bacteroidia bacterium]|nr:T9SS type A sorting domain-containing protein [Bacteroidia bacterium]